MPLDDVGDSEAVSESAPGAHAGLNSGQPGTRNLEPIWIWGVPFAPVSMAEAVRAIESLIEARRPSYVITANVHYAMLSHENPDVRAINEKAALILADGAPLVWASRWQGRPLPERVAGADLIFELSAEAARAGYRLYFLGGADGVADEAARRLRERYPGLQIVGTACPPFRELSPPEEAALIEQINESGADILLVAFGQPKGERWIVRNLGRLTVPVSVQIGASLDFAADRVSRAPRWMQRSGLEWAFRLGLEPRRLLGRYSRNALFIARMTARDVRRAIARPHSSG